MSEPTTRFRLIPNATAAAAVDTAAERLADIASQSVLSTGVGNEADFGTVNIAAGAANSGVLTILWDVTADGGNSQVDTFKLWLSSNGFDQAGSVVKFQPLSGADNAAPSLTENYVVNAVVGSYTWATMPEAEPGAINIYPTDEGSSMALSTTADDVVMWAMYAAIAASETTGTYKGTDAGFELQFSFKYSYS
ncbi:MAG: hypothetical protein EHM49_00905 [Deltaproteobacteria bacterium]|nr:MAG: hypothetical protein EHM49_00905 [Deltaproteobacteria bacterium]